MDEARETVSAKRIYNAKVKREKKSTYTFVSEATYTGEWKGGFRDGYGTQRWKDGA